jgi:hypothetical protein
VQIILASGGSVRGRGVDGAQPTPCQLPSSATFPANPPASPSLVRPNVVTPVLTSVAKLGGLADVQGDRQDQFGSAVAFDVDNAVVAFPEKTLRAPTPGAVLDFFRVAGTWTLQATLLPPASRRGPRFGSAVAISKDTLVVGVAGSASSPGGAYVFFAPDRPGRCSPPSPDSTNRCLRQLRSKVAVSAIRRSCPHPWPARGSEAARGRSTSLLAPARPGANNRKCCPPTLPPMTSSDPLVAVEGNTILIGASQDERQAGIDAGSAYVFTQSEASGASQRKLLASSAASRRLVWVGRLAFGDRGRGGRAGRRFRTLTRFRGAFVFERSGSSWTQTATLSPPSPSSFARYGSAVGVSFGVAILGSASYYANPRPPTSSATSPEPGDRSRGPEREPGIAPEFGTAVAASGGVRRDRAPGFDDTGAAFVFNFTSGAWVQQARLDNTGTTRGDAFARRWRWTGNTMPSAAPWTTPPPLADPDPSRSSRARAAFGPSSKSSFPSPGNAAVRP